MQGKDTKRKFKYPVKTGPTNFIWPNETFWYRDKTIPNDVKAARKRGKENYWKYFHKSKKYGRTASLFLPLPPAQTEKIYDYI